MACIDIRKKYSSNVYKDKSVSSFTKQLKVSPYDDHMRRWVINESFTYIIGDLDGDESVIVPVGFITDFATIPRYLWSILPPTGRYGKAAVVHDYLCTYKTVKTNDGIRKISRKEGDDIFLEAMGVSNVHPIVRYTMYAVVRIYAFIKNKK